MPTDVCEMKEFQREEARGGVGEAGQENSQSVILRWREKMFGFSLHLHGGGGRTKDEADFYIVNVLECSPPAEECCTRIKT